MGELPIGLFVILILLLALSAFFSSSETAFSSVNRIRLKNYVDEKKKGSEKALYIYENFDKSLSTILVGNNIVNIAATTIAAKVTNDLLGESTMGMIINTVVMTILVLTFGEILPKSFAKENAERLALSISGVLYTLMKVLTPITFFFVKLKDWASKLVRHRNESPSVTEEELKVMVDISQEEGVIDEKEKDLVHRSLDFNDISVGEILTPRIDMIAIGIERSIDEIKEIFLEERYSRIPIFEGNNDNIIGILYERDFFSYLVQNREVNVKELLRTPLYVVESTKIATLLPELQRTKLHMAIVIDEFGGTSGLVTMEDILEELVGEIWDEHEEKVKSVIQVDENTFKFNGEISMDDFSRHLKINPSGNSFKSLGGWIVNEFERLPEQGEELVYKNLVITIDKIENRRIRKLTVRINSEEEE